LQDYDADNESYLLQLPSLFPVYSTDTTNTNNTIVLRVPINEAKIFKEQWNNLIITSGDAVIVNDKFLITKLIIKNKNTQRTYIYDRKISTDYAPSNIEYDFGDIEVDVSGN